MPKRTILKEWQEFAKFWKKVKPTYKPSKIEIKLVFERFLKKVLRERGKNLKVLILGATPEIRDLLARYKLDVTLLDANKIMILAMEKLVSRKNPKEKAVIGNWLKMPFKNNSFDLVMSDHPTSSIDFKKAPKFFSEIQRVLKLEGFMVVDIHINPKLSPLTLEGYIKKYRKNKKWFSNYDNKVLACARVYMGDKNYYNPRTFRSYMGKMEADLEKMYKAGRLTKKELSDLEVGFGKKLVVNFYPKIAAIKVIQKYFKILNYYSLKIHPVYQYYWPCAALSLKKK